MIQISKIGKNQSAPTTTQHLTSDSFRDSKNGKEYFQQQDIPSQITISNVHFIEDQRQNTSQVGKRFIKTPNQHSNAANIFRVKPSNTTEKKDKFTYVRYQNYTSTRAKKTTQQKIFQINSFVKKLTQNIKEEEEEVPEISQTKFKALKKIIQYYDIKNLDRSQYTNVIKSFGLQIGSMRAEKKNSSFSEEKKNNQKRKIKAVSFNRTNKKIETKMFDRTFEEPPAKNSVFPSRQIISEQSFKTGSLDRQQALSLFNSLQVRKDKMKVSSPRKFKFTSGQNCILEKVNKYRQFLFMLNYSNKLYRPLDIQFYPVPLRFYIGKGNNGNLIRSLMKKRFWFQQTNEKEAHFIWTQIKLPQTFKKQESAVAAINEFPPKTTRKSVCRLPSSKNQPINRILSNEEVKQMVTLQEYVKNRHVSSFEDRLKHTSRKVKKDLITFQQIVHNHFPGNGLLGNKKALFLCLNQYCKKMNLDVNQIVPTTFIINQGLKDPTLLQITDYHNERKKQKKNTFWILKPGQFSNRGNGIQCTNKIEDIKKRVVKVTKETKRGSLIVQQYITRPLLYNGRKFDLRTYMLVTCHNGKTKAFWYQQGYVRTSSAFFSLDDIDPYIHLTNDAVQRNADSYSYFQEGNKLSYSQLQRYLDGLPSLGRTLDLYNVLIPKMKEIASMTVKSTWLALNRENKDKNFQLFGLDFMVDEDFKPWLIEVNTNPCLQLSSPVLQRMIPYMIQNVMRIGLDTMFPPPDNFGNNYKYNIPENSLHYNKFELIFDSDRDGPPIKMIYEQGQFFKELQGLQQDKNEFKQEGEFINVDQL